MSWGKTGSYQDGDSHICHKPRSSAEEEPTSRRISKPLSNLPPAHGLSHQCEPGMCDPECGPLLLARFRFCRFGRLPARERSQEQAVGGRRKLPAGPV
jgi:hypothetical protein